jgi:MFS family permease
MSVWRFGMAAAGLVVFAVVYAVFAMAPSHMALYGAMAFYGLYYALTQPVLKAMVVDTVPREARGRAFGIFYFVTSVAALLASVITGRLWKSYGAETPLLLSAALAIVAAVLLMSTRVVFRKAVASSE